MIKTPNATLKRIGFIFILLTLISTVLSKSGVHLFFVLALALSFFVLFKTRNLNLPSLSPPNRIAVFFILSTYLISAVSGLFSEGSVPSFRVSLLDNATMLFWIPLVVFNGTKTHQKYLLQSFLGACLLGSIYSFFLFWKLEGAHYTSEIRIASFFDVSRWALIIMMGALIAFVEVAENFKKNKRRFLSYLFLFLISSISLILSNSRGPWLGLAFGILIYVLIFKRKLLALLMLISALGLGALSQSPELSSRLQSIYNVKSNGSNLGRLHMWRVALDFYKEHPLWGVGAGNTEKPLRRFLSQQTPEYLQQHLVEQFSFRDHHSSYLNSLNEYGLLFFLVFWLSLFFLVIYNFKNLNTVERKSSWIIVVSYLGVGLFYSEMFSYTAYAFWYFVSVFTLDFSGSSKPVG